jgi:hypothetical protein
MGQVIRSGDPGGNLEWGSGEEFGGTKKTSDMGTKEKSGKILKIGFSGC